MSTSTVDRTQAGAKKGRPKERKERMGGGDVHKWSSGEFVTVEKSQVSGGESSQRKKGKTEEKTWMYLPHRTCELQIAKGKEPSGLRTIDLSRLQGRGPVWKTPKSSG